MVRVLIACLLCVWQQAIAAPPRSAHVAVGITAPVALAGFDERQLEVRLYAHEPLLADAPATLVDLWRGPFSHRGGEPTTLWVDLGDAAPLEPRLRYYVTVFLLKDGNRTHIGEQQGRSGPIDVLTDGHPARIEALFRPVR